MIQPLKLNKEWRPIQTSTITDFHRQNNLVRIPKTNPRHLGVSSTPRHHFVNVLQSTRSNSMNSKFF